MESQKPVMNKKKPLKKGMAKIEYVACQNRVKELQKQGCDILKIYTHLVDEGLVTMSYTGFYENHTQRRKKSAGRNKNPPGLNIMSAIEPVTPDKRPQMGGQNMTVLPSNNIIALDAMMKKNLVKNQAFTESSLILPGENQADHEAQADKLVGDPKK